MIDSRKDGGSPSFSGLRPQLNLRNAGSNPAGVSKETKETKETEMNLYKISQDENNDYDTYDSAIVAAETEDAAKRTHPSGDDTNWGDSWDGWCRP